MTSLAKATNPARADRRRTGGRLARLSAGVLLAGAVAACDGDDPGTPGGSGGATTTSPAGGSVTSSGGGGTGANGGTGGSGGTGGGSFSQFEGFDGADYVIPQECVDACALAASCGGEPEAPCQKLCAARYFFYTFAAPSGCWSSFDALLGCVAGLTCAEHSQYAGSAGADGPCAPPHATSLGDPACGAIPSPCPDYCAKRASCDVSLDAGTCELHCGTDLGKAGKQVALTCFDALSAYLACAAVRSCDELSAHAGCEPEESALPEACL